MMLDKICAHLHNYFCAPADACANTYTIENGALDLTGIVLDGQYFRVTGSVFNDGVHIYPAEDLTDETFEGEIWPMKVPRAVLELSAEIEAWQTQYGAAMASPFQSENVIGVYSYTKQGGNASKNTAQAEADGWKKVFKSRLNEWRKCR